MIKTPSNVFSVLNKKAFISEAKVLIVYKIIYF